jgi:demethylmenaquinone methyltransferase / 2-methoxy-6-polyprenyl-1,4-benzoquinol methylase
MFMKYSKWINSHGRDRTTGLSRASQKMAYFGYQEIPEDDKTEWVLRHFNTVARRYDLMNTLLSFGIHHLWKRTAVQMLDLSPGQRVLDVCGGTGDLAILAARAVDTTGNVVIYDINRLMIDAGRNKVIGSGLKKQIRWVQGDAERLPFPDAYFDAAMVGFGIRNVTRMDQGFAEMQRILKPGGKMMCLEFSKPTAPVFRWLYDFYSFHIMPLLGEIIVGSRGAYTHLPESIRTWALPEEITALLKRIGFSRVITRKLTNGISVIHVATK